METTGGLEGWDDLRILLVLHRRGSFLHAGRALGIATSTVTRRVSALEQRLAVRLVERGRHGVTFTGAGVRLIALAQEVDSRLAVGARDVSGADERLEGRIRVTCGDGFVRFLSRVIATFRHEHPVVTIDLVVDHRALDLVRREADIGLRTTRPSAESLIVRRLGDLTYGLFASAAYLERARPLRTTRDLPHHDFVGFDEPLHRQPEMRWLEDHGATRFAVRCNTNDALVEAALSGQGVVALPRILAASHPTLRPVVATAALPSKPVLLAMRRELRSVVRMRAFAQAIGDAFAAGVPLPRAPHAPARCGPGIQGNGPAGRGPRRGPIG